MITYITIHAILIVISIITLFYSSSVYSLFKKDTIYMVIMFILFSPVGYFALLLVAIYEKTKSPIINAKFKLVKYLDKKHGKEDE